MGIDELENKIRKDIQIVTKKVCARKTHKQGKLTAHTRDLTEKRRKPNKTSTEYKDLNTTIKKEVRRDIRSYNTELIDSD